jgi:hypothetical protein
LSWQFDSAVGFDLLSHIICGVLMTIRERNWSQLNGHIKSRIAHNP